MNIQNILISELKPYANNPRKNANAVDAVANSIKEFGFRVPLVIDKNYEIVAGHTRYIAALKLALTEVPCVIADDLSEAQIKAFRLADNKTHELSEWDFDLLDAELKELFAFDMADFGFDFEIVASDKPFENKEIDTETFADENFDCECPKCGFKFNV